MTYTIVVTGGGGFLGAHLCERLLGEGRGLLCLAGTLLREGAC